MNQPIEVIKKERKKQVQLLNDVPAFAEKASKEQTQEQPRRETRASHFMQTFF